MDKYSVWAAAHRYDTEICCKFSDSNNNPIFINYLFYCRCAGFIKSSVKHIVFDLSKNYNHFCLSISTMCFYLLLILHTTLLDSPVGCIVEAGFNR